jgi:hypothetical protein
MSPTYRKIVWTEHSKIKMKQYGLSVSKLLNILYRPERKEKAIVPGLVAVMKTNKKPAKTKILFKEKPEPSSSRWRGTSASQRKAPGEIWLMYKDAKNVKDGAIRKIISAWRYPGITKPGQEPPIPEDTRQELENNNY